eukprot:3924911-Heterocapsa_arctica.AAC.1
MPVDLAVHRVEQQVPAVDDCLLIGCAALRRREEQILRPGPFEAPLVDDSPQEMERTQRCRIASQ